MELDDEELKATKELLEKSLNKIIENKKEKAEPIKILELFGGIGACTRAFDRLNIPYNVVDYVEIDKYAVASYNAINNTNFEPQDITTWNKDIEVDFVMHGSPCQDFSVAGLGKGGDEGTGTRSSLMYETIRIVKKLKPKIILWENVKNLLSTKHKHNFDNYIYTLRDLGYNSFYEVLNAKDYGIPQNRERVFTLSIRQDIYNGFYDFPQKEPLQLKLKDMLESNVDEKYYLSNTNILGRLNTTYERYNIKNHLVNNWDIHQTILARYDGAPSLLMQNGNEIIEKENIQQTLDILNQSALLQPVDREYKKHGKEREEHLEFRNDNCSHALRTEAIPFIAIKNNTKKGYLLAYEGDGIDLENPNSKTRRGRVQKEMIQTLNTSDTKGVVTENLRIRKLTPKECWRLMGFNDSEFDKASKVNSNTQLYKQAGNSIVVNVLEKILNQLFFNTKDNLGEQITFDKLQGGE